jgi:hypothetical protein
MMFYIFVSISKVYNSKNDDSENARLSQEQNNSRKRQIQDVSCTTNESLTFISDEESKETIEPTNKKIVLDQQDCIVQDEIDVQIEVQVENQRKIKHANCKEGNKCNAVKKS